MTFKEAQERMYELNWQRDRILEEIVEAGKRLDAAIMESRTLLSEFATLSLKAPKQVEQPCGCMKPAKSVGEVCPHHRRG
jgi:hypothetical protein